MIGTEEMNMGALCNLSGAVLSASAGLYEVLWLTRAGRQPEQSASAGRNVSLLTLPKIARLHLVIVKSRTILVSFIMNFEVLYR